LVIGAEQKLLRSSSHTREHLLARLASEVSIRYVALWASSVTLTRFVISNESSSQGKRHGCPVGVTPNEERLARPSNYSGERRADSLNCVLLHGFPLARLSQLSINDQHGDTMNERPGESCD